MSEHSPVEGITHTTTYHYSLVQVVVVVKLLVEIVIALVAVLVGEREFSSSRVFLCSKHVFTFTS